MKHNLDEFKTSFFVLNFDESIKRKYGTIRDDLSSAGISDACHFSSMPSQSIWIFRMRSDMKG